MAAVDTVLQQLLEDWRYFGDRIARQTFGDATYPRRYMLPSDKKGWDGDPTKIEDLKKPFVRDTVNAAATDAYTGGGSIGTASGSSLQISYLGMLERAFRARHMTPVRAFIHSAGRRHAHGDTEGLLTGVTLNYIQDMLDSGTT